MAQTMSASSASAALAAGPAVGRARRRAPAAGAPALVLPRAPRGRGSAAYGRQRTTCVAQVDPAALKLADITVDGAYLEFNASRTKTRLAIPSKGRMAEDTIGLLSECQMKVNKINERQYVADISQFPTMEVWFQRASDVMRKLRTGDVDLGIVGYDMFVEYGEGDPDLMVIHDELSFGKCYLALGVPKNGPLKDVMSVKELAAHPLFTEKRPMRVVTGYHYIAREFFASQGFKHVTLLHADGALEAAPQMGCADLILDLVSSGVTLRENNLREIEGGRMLDSQGVLVASRRALLQRPGALEIVHEMLERMEAHLRAVGQFTVVAHMRGSSAKAVAAKLLEDPQLAGLQGPTIAPVYTKQAGNATEGEYYAVTICVARKRLYEAVKRLRELGGSGVLVTELTYLFDEEPPRWRALLNKLKLEPKA